MISGYVPFAAPHNLLVPRSHYGLYVKADASQVTYRGPHSGAKVLAELCKGGNRKWVIHRVQVSYSGAYSAGNGRCQST